MKKLFFLIVVAIFTINATFAQTTIKGVILDSLSKEGVPFATVAVTKEGTLNDFAMTGITETDGSFSGTVKGRGNFVITMRSTGKQTIVKNFTLKGEQVFNFGTILMSDLVDTLGTVEVVAIKQLVTSEAGKMKYNAEADPENKTSTVLDMLRKVPMVTVDGQDNISINGNSSFQVFVNGKKNTMLSSRPSEMLKSMPASSVKNIEVITDPGAKYDAEGAGGIINLITDKKQKMNQTSGTLRAEKGITRESYGGDFSIQRGKFTASVNATIFHNENDMEFNGLNTQIMSSGDYNTLSKSKSTNKTNFGNAGFEASYEIDTLNLISINGGYDYWTSKRNGSMKYLVNNEFETENLTDNKSVYSGYWAGLDYQHTFKSNPEKTLTFSYEMWDGWDKTTDKTVGANSLISSPYDFSGKKYENDGRSGEHTFQLDFATPLVKNLKMESGVKYIIRPKASKGDNYSSDVNGDYIYDESQSIDLDYVDNIAAAYTQFSQKIDKLTLKAGLRYEYTFLNADYKKGNGEDFSKDYDNFVPTFAATYAISMQQNINFTYNMRISRPREEQLNPFREISPLSVSYGNTGLECENFHNFGLSYGYFSMKHNVNINLRHSFCNNGISQYSFYLDNLLNSTYDNLTELANTSLNIYYNYNITKNARFSTNYSLSYVDTRNEQIFAKNHGWQSNGYASFMYTFPANVKASLGCFFSTRSYNLQGYRDGLAIGNFSVGKDFFNDRLSITCSGTLSLKDGKYLKMSTVSSGSDFRNTSDMKFKIGNIGVSASWRFGGHINVKKANKTIENDDYSKDSKGGSDIPGM
ncbi:MAG: outer membrane beta-barrel protein [Bacteroidales bacterium]|nr:outer membrane beta-barrel protein [Bacteroidales bacterium]